MSEIEDEKKKERREFAVDVAAIPDLVVKDNLSRGFLKRRMAQANTSPRVQKGKAIRARHHFENAGEPQAGQQRESDD